MNLKKMIPISLAATLALSAIGAVAYLDKIIASTVERTGTRTLGVRTSVRGVALDLLAGRLGVKEVRIANPQTFDSPHLLQVGDSRMAVDLASLRGATIVVPEISIRDVKLNLEFRNTRTNVGEVLDHLRSGASLRQSGPDAAPPSKRFVIRELRFENIAAQVVFSLGDVGPRTATVSIPEVRLTNIGPGGQGVSLAELTGIVVTSLLDAVCRSDMELPDPIVNQLTAELAGLRIERGEIIGTVRSTVDQAATEAEKAIEEQTRGALGVLRRGDGG